MTKKYVYFVSYQVLDRDGTYRFMHDEMEVDDKIKSIDDIDLMEEFFEADDEESLNIKSAVVVNFILLREEETK